MAMLSSVQPTAGYVVLHEEGAGDGCVGEAYAERV